MFFMFFLTAIVGLVVLYVIKQTFFGYKGIPPSIGGIPWLGRAIEFGTRPIQLFLESYKKHGEMFTIPIFGETMIMCAGDSASIFYKADEEVFSAAEAYKFTVPAFGKGIVYDAPSHLFQEQRKIMTEGLTIQRFKLYVPWMEEEAKNYFTEKWGNEAKSELLQDFSECTVLTSTRCLQGKEIRKRSKDFARLFFELDAGLNPLGFFFPNLPLPGMNATRHARKEMGKMFQEIINERRRNNDEQHEDIIQTLMSTAYKSGESVPDEHIIGLMVGLMLAGQHTSNVTSTWTGLEIIRNKDIYEKLVEEQKRVLDGKTLDYDRLKEMTLLDNVIRETLRMHPPLMLLIRRVLKDVQHNGYNIPKGTLVCNSPFLQHYTEWGYKDPLTFDPTRFDKEQERKPYSFAAFGAGKHACIGEKFAFLQIKTIWSWLLRNYTFEHLEQNMNKPNFTTMIIGPTPPVKVAVKKIIK